GAPGSFTHLALGQQHRIFATKTSNDFTLITDEHHAFAGKRFVPHLVRRAGLHTTVIPEEIEGRKGFLLREFEVDDTGVGERDVVAMGPTNLTIYHTRGCAIRLR